MSPIDILLAVLGDARKIALIAFISAVLGALISLLLPASYDASVSFYPESRPSGISLPPSIANFASMYGLADMGGSESPRFYASIATSAAVLDPILTDSMAVSDSLAVRRPLLSLLKIKGGSLQRRMTDGRRALRDIMDVNANIQTNVVSVTVTSRDPLLAAEIANAVLKQVNAFNVERRSTRARAARIFGESRQRWARDQLHMAEDSVRDFLVANRTFESSPTLRLRYDELQRQVALAQDVYVSVSQQLEQSRVQEVNDVPAITIVDTAMVPPRRARPKRRNIVLVFLALGLLGGAADVTTHTIVRARLEEGDQELRRAIDGFRQLYERLMNRVPWLRRRRNTA